MCRPGQGSPTWPLSPTPTLAGSWAGGRFHDGHLHGPRRDRASHLDPPTRRRTRPERRLRSNPGVRSADALTRTSVPAPSKIVSASASGLPAPSLDHSRIAGSGERVAAEVGAQQDSVRVLPGVENTRTPTQQRRRSLIPATRHHRADIPKPRHPTAPELKKPDDGAPVVFPNPGTAGRSMRM